MAKTPQKRALATREKILDGLENLLERKEFEMISIAELAREAGVAVGSVYSHFKDKNALLPALLDRQVQRVEARLAQLRETGELDGISIHSRNGMSLRELLNISVKSALDQVQQSLGVRRALLTYRRMNPGLEIPLSEKLAQEALDALATQFELYRDEIVHEDLREAGRMVTYFVNMVFLDRIVFVSASSIDRFRPDDEALVAAYTDMIHRYLTQPPSQPS